MQALQALQAIHFAHPAYLWLLLIFVPMIAWHVLKHRRQRASLSISTTSPFAGLGRSWRQYAVYLLFPLRLLAIACLIIILARPQIRGGWSTTSTEGTDIVVALDISSSMLARDFQPDRLEAAKEIAGRFVVQRENDNVGLVIFAGESLTGVPMTTDRAVLASYIESISMDQLADGTAIGEGIATSLNRLREGQAESKTVILITDGSNNTGIISPLAAADAAKELGVRIYTIGIGTMGMADMPVSTPLGIRYEKQKVVIDEATLQQIADRTGGKYFRATDNRALEKVFDEIDHMTQTKMDVRHFSHTEDRYQIFAWLLLLFFGLELLLRYTVARSIP